MAILKAFKGIRPKKELVKNIACRPYDVLNEQEARIETKGDPNSFYHVIKPEIDFPDDFDHYSPEIYQKGKDNFARMFREGVFFQDEKDCIYIYAQTMNGRKQYGIVGAAAVDDYVNNVIRKHELTRPDKEEDRKNHVRVSNLNYEPVFFAYQQVKALDEIVSKVAAGTPEYDFVTEDGIGHTFWVIKDDAVINSIISEFAKIKYTYVADGHHRTAAAALVGKERREKNPNHTGNEEYNFFLAVHFPDNQLAILDYNRVIKDLNGLTNDQFLDKLKENFVVEEKGSEIYKPAKLHEFSLYIDGKWYMLTSKPGTFNEMTLLVF